MLSPIVFLIASLLFRKTAHAMHNITVDDSDTTVTYSGLWQRGSSPLDYGGSHAWSIDPNATSTFTFTGVAVYYWSPLWPYVVSTRLTLDDRTPVVLNLEDYSNGVSNTTNNETVQSQIVWGVGGLDNTTHKLVASIDPAHGAYVEMDAITFTVSDASDAPPSSGSSQNITVIAATVGGIVLIALVALLAYLMYIRRRRQSNNVQPPYVPQPQFPARTPFFPHSQSSGTFTPSPFPQTFDQSTQPLVSRPPPGPYPNTPNVSTYTGQPIPMGSSFSETPQMSPTDPSPYNNWNPVTQSPQGSAPSLPQPPPGAASPQVPPPGTQWRGSIAYTDAAMSEAPTTSSSDAKGRRTGKGSSADIPAPPAYSLH